jgi:hypothetical protein
MLALGRKLRATAATGATGRITLLIESDNEQAFFQSPANPRPRDQSVLRRAAGAAVHGCPLQKTRYASTMENAHFPDLAGESRDIWDQNARWWDARMGRATTGTGC